jgi:transcriptional antiterminator RfaH
MNPALNLLKAVPRLAWFCVRTQPKHEHIAAARLVRYAGIEVFHPRIQFRRPTRRGLVSTTESLFPSYLFVRFDLSTCLNLVQYSGGVTGVVHFGTHWPTVPGEVIDSLRQWFGDSEVRQIGSSLAVGDTVTIANGAFAGLEAVVTRIMPGRERVAVLLDFLGRQTVLDVKTADLDFKVSGRSIKELSAA